MGKHSKEPGPGTDFDAQYEASQQAAPAGEPTLQQKVDAYTEARREDAAAARVRDETQTSTIARFLGRKK